MGHGLSGNQHSNFNGDKKNVHESVTELKETLQTSEEAKSEKLNLISIISRATIMKGDHADLDSTKALAKISERKKIGIRPIVKPLNREYGIYY